METSKDQEHPSGIDVTTSTRTPESAVAPETEPGSFVDASPSPKLATRELDRCRALMLDDGSRCPLTRVEYRWCARHLDQHVLLHDDLLQDLKNRGWHDWVQLCGYWRETNSALLDAYNSFQAELALRVIITHVLYAGDEDDEHARAVRTTLGHRGNLAIHMAFKQTDASARLPVKPFIAEFLAGAEARILPPAIPPGAPVPVAPVNSFAPPAPFAVREYLDRIVDVKIGDLPPLTPAEARLPEVRVSGDAFAGWEVWWVNSGIGDGESVAATGEVDWGSESEGEAASLEASTSGREGDTVEAQVNAAVEVGD